MTLFWLFLLFVTVLAAVSLTLGRTMLLVAGRARELPVGAALRLLDHPIARLDHARITEIVRWRNDLLVGFDSASGSWIDPDHRAGGAHTTVVGGLTGFAGQLRVAHATRDARTKRLLAQWQQPGQSITAVITASGTAAFVDQRSRQALLGEQTQARRR